MDKEARTGSHSLLDLMTKLLIRSPKPTPIILGETAGWQSSPSP